MYGRPSIWVLFLESKWISALRATDVATVLFMQITTQRRKWETNMAPRPSSGPPAKAAPTSQRCCFAPVPPSTRSACTLGRRCSSLPGRMMNGERGSVRISGHNVITHDDDDFSRRGACEYIHEPFRPIYSAEMVHNYTFTLKSTYFINGSHCTFC